jgi:HSP20 family protein
MATRNWTPFTEMLTLRDAMNQLMEDSFVRPGASAVGAAQASYSFPLNIHGTTDELKIEALLPGVSEEDVQVDIDRGVLTITARRHAWEHREGEIWYLREFNPGQFSRSLSLPFPVETERASANFTNGILSLTLPKAEAAKPKTIRIGAGQHQQVQLNDGQSDQK